MSRYQQDQASWEWIDQEEERWNAENIKGFNHHSSMNELVAAQPILDQMLSSFDSIFGRDSKESI